MFLRRSAFRQNHSIHSMPFCTEITAALSMQLDKSRAQASASVLANRIQMCTKKIIRKISLCEYFRSFLFTSSERGKSLSLVTNLLFYSFSILSFSRCLFFPFILLFYYCCVGEVFDQYSHSFPILPFSSLLVERTFSSFSFILVLKAALPIFACGV